MWQGIRRESSGDVVRYEEEVKGIESVVKGMWRGRREMFDINVYGGW